MQNSHSSGLTLAELRVLGTEVFEFLQKFDLWQDKFRQRTTGQIP